MTSSSWKKCKISDIKAPISHSLVGGPFGSNLVSHDYTPSGIPVIRGQNMGFGRWIGGEFVFISQQKAEKLSANIARPHDLIFTQRGTIGQVSVVPEKPYHEYVISQSQMKVTVDHSKTDVIFLYYLFKTPEQQEFIKQNAIQTGVPHTNLEHLRNTPIKLPLLAEQHNIARILGSLDDKIDLNRQMNETLEAMARVIFQSWFVDFDPVRAKVERRDTGLPPEIAALFPDGFEEVDGREVPRGWEAKPLDQIATFLNGLALQKYPPDGEDYLPVIKISQLRKGDTEGSDKASGDISSEYIVDDGDVLFSWSGSLDVVIWCGGKGALNQHLFKITSDRYPKWFYYLWALHHLPDFRLIAEGKATTMGHIQRHHLSDAMVLVPSEKQMRAMNKTLESLINKIISNKVESRTLAQIRDALLPKLMSGEIEMRFEKTLR